MIIFGAAFGPHHFCRRTPLFSIKNAYFFFLEKKQEKDKEKNTKRKSKKAGGKNTKQGFAAQPFPAPWQQQQPPHAAHQMVPIPCGNSELERARSGPFMGQTRLPRDHQHYADRQLPPATMHTQQPARSQMDPLAHTARRTYAGPQSLAMMEWKPLP